MILAKDPPDIEAEPDGNRPSPLTSEQVLLGPILPTTYLVRGPDGKGTTSSFRNDPGQVCRRWPTEISAGSATGSVRSHKQQIVAAPIFA